MRRTAASMVFLLVSSALAGCQAGASTAGVPAASETVQESEGSEESEVAQELSADDFVHEGRRYELSCGVIDPDLIETTPFATGAAELGVSEPLHRVRGVDPAVSVAVPDDLCELAPGQAWASASAAEGYSC